MHTTAWALMRAPLALLTSTLACACGGSHAPALGTVDATTDTSAHADAADAMPAFEGGSCAMSNGHYDPPSRNHLPPGTPITYATNPPCGGDHYPIWAIWGPHAHPLPPGYWVHNMEHGGVVFLYRCADRAACPDLAASVENVAASLPADPICDPEAGVMNRVLVLPDPDLPAGVQVAVASWGYYYTSSCVEPAVLASFYADHFGQGPEVECGQGFIGEFPPDTDAAVDGMAPADATGDSSATG